MGGSKVLKAYLFEKLNKLVFLESLNRTYILTFTEKILSQQNKVFSLSNHIQKHYLDPWVLTFPLPPSPPVSYMMQSRVLVQQLFPIQLALLQLSY